MYFNLLGYIALILLVYLYIYSMLASRDSDQDTDRQREGGKKVTTIIQTSLYDITVYMYEYGIILSD